LEDLCEVDGFDDSFEASIFCRWDGLGVEDARGHAGAGVDEPGAEMGDGVLGVAGVAGEDEGGGEGGDVEAEVEKCVAVGREGIGVGAAVVQDVRTGWVGGVGEVIFGFGVEVVWGAGAARARQGGEWNWRLVEVAVGEAEDPVVVDGGDVESGGGLDLGSAAVCAQKVRRVAAMGFSTLGRKGSTCGVGG
jgi:hypothetical protein